ncbi:MAG: nitrilase-related carbon-nitrogen hydrolase [Thermoleophilaceae bacterium]
MEGDAVEGQGPALAPGEFTAVCCQQETENAVDREAVERNLAHMLELVDWAVEGYMGHGAPIRLIVFPELVLHGAAGYSWSEQRRVACEIPGAETERIAAKAREYGTYVVAGSLLERDETYDAIFNTLVMFGPSGEIALRYRKVNVWYPLEPAQSPVDLLAAGYDVERHPLFPVARTEIGNIGGYICYDGLFPEVTRQLAFNGAEIFARASAFMDPWGTGPTGTCGLADRMRSIENMSYSVSCQQGSTLRSSPPYSWPGHSMIVDFEGRVLAEGDRGEQIVKARIDAHRVRGFRRSILTHNLLAQNRHEAYDYMSRPAAPAHPELAERTDVGLQEYEQMTKAGAERFWSDYYGEPCEFPTLSTPFWRAQRERAAREASSRVFDGSR